MERHEKIVYTRGAHWVKIPLNTTQRICGPTGGQTDRLGIKNVKKSPATVLAQVHLYLCSACSDKLRSGAEALVALCPCLCTSHLSRMFLFRPKDK